jgi:hypothetical protein
MAAAAGIAAGAAPAVVAAMPVAPAAGSSRAGDNGGRLRGEADVLAASHAFQHATDWHTRVPRR